MALVPCQVLRAAILLSYCSILCNYKAIDMPAHQTYGGSWKFLTFIDLTFSQVCRDGRYFPAYPKDGKDICLWIPVDSKTLQKREQEYSQWSVYQFTEKERDCFLRNNKVIQAVFFGICVLTDLSSLLTKGNDSQEQERQLKKLISLRDWVMAVLAFPVGVFVVTMFWSIYIYDRELVYPKLLDNFIPAWLNHGMHTTVLPFVLIEMRTTHHQYPSRSCGLAAVCTFAVGYILWVCWIHHVTGVWVYPLLEHLSPGVKIIFFAAVTVIINIFYLVGEVLNNYIWDTQKCIEEGKEKPKLD